MMKREYKERQKVIDNYKKISSALLKKVLLGFEDEICGCT
jgi:hypothetical protein